MIISLILTLIPLLVDGKCTFTVLDENLVPKPPGSRKYKYKLTTHSFLVALTHVPSIRTLMFVATKCRTYRCRKASKPSMQHSAVWEEDVICIKQHCDNTDVQPTLNDFGASIHATPTNRVSSRRPVSRWLQILSTRSIKEKFPCRWSP